MAALALLCFSGLGRGLWTPDEPREAGISREMLLTPTVVPLLNGVPFAQKPPLYYWLVAGLFGLTGGPSVAAARAVSGLAGLGTLLIIYLWGSRAASPRTGLIAAVVLMTSNQFFIATQWVRIDGLLMLTCALSFWAGWELVFRDGGRRALLGLYTGVVLAFWAKGLIGPAVIAVGLGAFLAFHRPRDSWKRFHTFLGAAALLLAMGAFVCLMYLENGADVIRNWLWENHVQRVLHPQGTGHVQPFHYYLWVLPLSLLPWLLPLALCFRRAFWTDEATAALRTFCAAAGGAGLLLLSAASTKRGVYLLPIIPPLALLMGAAVDHLIRSSETLERCGGVLRTSIRLQAILLLACGVAPFVALAMYTGSLGPATVLGLAVSLSLAVAGGVTLVRGSIASLSALSASSFLVALFASTLLLAPVADERKSFDEFVGWIDAQIPAGAPLHAYGADETVHGVVPFLTGREIIDIDSKLPKKSRAVPEDLPPLLLTHVKYGKPLHPVLQERYEELRSEIIGNRRTLGLWKLRVK